MTRAVWGEECQVRMYQACRAACAPAAAHSAPGMPPAFRAGCEEAGRGGAGTHQIRGAICNGHFYLGGGGSATRCPKRSPRAQQINHKVGAAPAELVVGVGGSQGEQHLCWGGAAAVFSADNGGGGGGWH